MNYSVSIVIVGASPNYPLRKLIRILKEDRARGYREQERPAFPKIKKERRQTVCPSVDGVVHCTDIGISKHEPSKTQN